MHNNEAMSLSCLPSVMNPARDLAEQRMNAAKRSFSRAVVSGDPILIDAALAAVNRAMDDLKAEENP